MLKSSQKTINKYFSYKQDLLIELTQITNILTTNNLLQQTH